MSHSITTISALLFVEEPVFYFFCLWRSSHEKAKSILLNVSIQGSPSAFQKYIVNAMAINNAYLKTIY